MFRKQIETRRFSFTPYYYREQEEDEDQPRIRFRRLRRYERPKRRSVLGLVVIALILLWMLIYFTDLKNSARTMEMQDIRVEEVIVN